EQEKWPPSALPWSFLHDQCQGQRGASMPIFGGLSGGHDLGTTAVTGERFCDDTVFTGLITRGLDLKRHSLSPGGSGKAAAVGLCFIFPGIYTLSLLYGHCNQTFLDR
ncbi:hypothetical protein STEG23_028621, partial [Scotinomys teguina]